MTSPRLIPWPLRLGALSALFAAACQGESTPPARPILSEAPSGLCAVAASMPMAVRYDAETLCGRVEGVRQGTFQGLRIVPPEKDLRAGFSKGAQGVDALLGRRAVWRFDGVDIARPKDDARSQEAVLYTARALRKLRQVPEMRRVMDDLRRYSEPPRYGAFVNRVKTLVVSFDRTPTFIAAQTTLLDPKPKARGSNQAYDNVAFLSIDIESIHGHLPDRGSRPIYGKAEDEENYRLYMADGLIYSLGHELIHIYIDQQRTKSELAQAITSARIEKAGVDAEEVLVASNTLAILGDVVSEATRKEVSRVLRGLVRPTAVRWKLDRWCALAAKAPMGVLGFRCGG